LRTPASQESNPKPRRSAGNEFLLYFLREAALLLIHALGNWSLRNALCF